MFYKNEFSSKDICFDLYYTYRSCIVFSFHLANLWNKNINTGNLVVVCSSNGKVEFFLKKQNIT